MTLVQTLDRVDGADTAPWARRQPREGEEAIADFFDEVAPSHSIT